MKYLNQKGIFTEYQKNVFKMWTKGYIVEYAPEEGRWLQATDSLVMDKEYRYKLKEKIGSTKENPKYYKVRGEFRFRWVPELEQWLKGEETKFYDDKKREWHTLYPDRHIWDCITVYETK